MAKQVKYLVIILTLYSLINSCTDTIEADYENIHDPLNQDYLPTSANGLTCQFVYPNIGVLLFWMDNSEAEQKFEIERLEYPEANYIKIGEVPTDSTSYFDKFIPALNKLYKYRIKTLASNGNFTYSKPISYSNIIFSKPFNLNFTSNYYSYINLTWNDTNSIKDGFIIKRKDANNPWNLFEIIDTVSANTSSYLVTDMDTSKLYEFKIEVFNRYYRLENDDVLTLLFGMKPSIEWQSYDHSGSNCSEFSPNKNEIAIGASQNDVVFYNFNTFNSRTTNYSKNYLRYNNSGTKIGLLYNFASASEISLIDESTLNTYSNISIPSTGFCFSPDDSKLFLWNEHYTTLRLYNLNSSNGIWTKNVAQIYDAKFNYDGTKILCQTRSEILILDTQTGDVIQSIQPNGFGIECFDITNDGKYLFLVSRTVEAYFGGPIQIWDLNSMTMIKSIGNNFIKIKIAPDGKYLASAGTHVFIYRLADFEIMTSFTPGWGGGVSSLSFNHNSSLLGCCSMSAPPEVYALRKAWVERFVE